MGEIKLSAEQFNSTYVALNKAINSDVLDAMNSTATILKEHQGENALIDQAYENCKVLANNYNDGFYPSIVGLKKTFDTMFDLSEHLAKHANIGEVAQVDSSFKSGTVDASKVMV